MLYYKILFMFSLIMGSLITISSYSWISMWIGLEINLLSMIPLMNKTNNKYPTESAMKYFMVQAFASTGIMFCIIAASSMGILLELFTPTYIKLVMITSLMIKMGAAPFHFWVPEIMEGLSWLNVLIMLTWQKIAPMIMLSYTINMSAMFSIIIIASTIVSGIQGMNQTSMRKIMAYSSINHTSWMISALMSSTELWLYYYLIYSLISMNIILMMNKFKIYNIKQLNSIFSSNKIIKFMFFMNFLSLGGLPPFLGFFPKWVTIYFLISNKLYLTSFLLIVFTLMTLYFYMRLTFNAFSVSSEESLIIFFKYKNYLYISMNLVSIMNMFIFMYSYSFF